MDKTSDLVERLRVRDEKAKTDAAEWREAVRVVGIELTAPASEKLYYSLYGEAADTIERLRAGEVSRRVIMEGLKAFAEEEPDFSMSHAMRERAADFILAQPRAMIAAAEGE